MDDGIIEESLRCPSASEKEREKSKSKEIACLQLF